MTFRIIGQGVTSPTWNGSPPKSLKQYEGVTMPQTPAGSMVLSYWNTTQQSNQGKLSLASGGGNPQILPVPALANQPSIFINNWGANNLNLTNVSPNQNTTITVAAYGMGIGPKPRTLTVGTPIQLAVLETAQGVPQPNYMQLILTSNTSNLSIVCLIGGPLDGTGNNAYVFALNWVAGNPVPPGYSQVATGNYLSYEFNWGSSSLFVANMSPGTAAPVQVNLISL